jgi:hypothetical protein
VARRTPPRTGRPGRVILNLEHTRLTDATVQAVRGAAVAARTEAITEKRDNT